MDKGQGSEPEVLIFFGKRIKISLLYSETQSRIVCKGAGWAPWAERRGHVCMYTYVAFPVQVQAGGSNDGK